MEDFGGVNQLATGNWQQLLSFSSMLFEENPLYMLGKAINIGIHRCGIDAEMVKASFAFGETTGLHIDLE